MISCLWSGGPSLEAALRKGDVEAVLAVLADDPLPAACRTFTAGDSLWHIAANGGHVDLLAALVQRLGQVWPHHRANGAAATATANGAADGAAGGAVTSRSHDGAVPPMSCSRNPFQRLSDGLLGPRRDPCALSLVGWLSAPNLMGQTPLMSAARRGHAEAVKYLLSVGATPWSRDRGQCTVLHYAALGDSGACVEGVLAHPASARPPPGSRQRMARLVDLPNAWGYTPAHFAAAAGKPAALAALLAGGANIAARCWGEGHDWITGARGYTPLHLAARRGDMAMCRMMLRHYLEVLRDSGAVDPRLLADWRGVRPFSVALERGNKALAEILLPSTPLSYIFSGSDAVRLYNVPKLKALASAALQEALLTQIASAEAAAAARRQQQMLAEARASSALDASAPTALAPDPAAADSGAVVDGGAGGDAAATSSGSTAAAAPPPPRGSSTLAATVSGALDAVRRQSLRLKQRLRAPRPGRQRPSTDVARAASSGGGGGGGGGARGRVESALVRRSEDCDGRRSGAANASPSGTYTELAGDSYNGGRSGSGAAGASPPLHAAATGGDLSFVATGSDAPPTEVAGPSPQSTVSQLSYIGGGGGIRWLGTASPIDGGALPLPLGHPSPPLAQVGGASPPLPGGISPVRGTSYTSQRAPSETAGPFAGCPFLSPPPPPSLPPPEAVTSEPQGCPNAAITADGGDAAAAACCPGEHSVARVPAVHGAPPVLFAFAQPTPQSQSPPPPSTPSAIKLAPLQPYRSPLASADGGAAATVVPKRAWAHDGSGADNCGGVGVGTYGPAAVGIGGCLVTTTAAAAAAANEVDAVAGGSPRATLWSVLAALGRGGGTDSFSDALLTGCGGGGASVGVGVGGGGGESRRGSGRLVRVGSRPASGALGGALSGNPSGAAAAATSAVGGGGGGDGGTAIGSDTSENCCGICFERPAVLHIRPCRHVLCAECSREVTRMVETQAPSCPFCRGVVRGFGC